MRDPDTVTAKIELRQAGWKYIRRTRKWVYPLGPGEGVFIADSLREALRIHRAVKAAKQREN